MNVQHREEQILQPPVIILKYKLFHFIICIDTGGLTHVFDCHNDIPLQTLLDVFNIYEMSVRSFSGVLKAVDAAYRLICSLVKKK